MLSDGWSDPRCGECEEERGRLQEEEAKKRQAAFNQRRAGLDQDDRRERSGIPLRFSSKTFDGFTATTKDQRDALSVCKAYAEAFHKAKAQGRGLILCGAPGTGKTHLACAILDTVIQRSSAEGSYLSFSKAIRSVKQTYSKASNVTEQQAIDALCRPDLLVLDEIGVQFGSEAEKLIGFEIINARYEALKPTIIVSNLTPKEIEACLGDRVVDRLCENGGQMVVFRGASARTAGS